ncbi:MFS transporter [Bacillus sp. AGMB 02131]|uniref:MFS transporter n=1 Tax=Peribacillus faecalis TaxID=2772559 RepID=A0A927CXA9_9BACI|nr:MFS transporter [Peribacillus faecalis]MBD3108447.1 MFS transporter [Peribacillus faecalis]
MSAEQRKKIVILMVNMFIALASFGIIIPILPQYLESIGQGGKAAGLIIAIFAAAQFLMSPIAGKWADQYGRRKMIIFGLAGLALSMFIFYLSDSIWVLYGSRIIGGIGAALLIPAIFAYIADITTIDQRAKGNSLVSAAMSLGIVIGPGVGGFIADFGLKVPLLVSAIVAVAAVIFSIVMLKESKEDLGDAIAVPNEAMIVKIFKSVKTPYFILLIISLVMSFGLMAYESVLGLFVDYEFSATPQDIALMVTSTGVISVIVQLFVVDRLVRKFGESAILSFFIGLTTVGFLFSIVANNYFLFFGITLLIFLATSILRPVLNTLISKLAGNEQGFAMGMNNAYMSIGSILGPTLAGSLFDVNIIYPFVLGFFILAITFVISFIWKQKANGKMAKAS